ncbi:MAG: dUTP diphosphatase [Candidatus Sericytochromatia bacterium]|nr:dUTP diphosphatase [Candidatus Sericytochromatia bacterium]
MILKIMKINEDAIIPSYAHEGDVGLDIYSVEEKNILSGESALISTGIKIELPENTEAQIRPRSGLALNHSITVLNSPGSIDYGYRGEIKVILINHGKNTFKVEKKMKIAQMAIKPVLKIEIEEVNSLGSTSRNSSGFGSTGKF